MATGELSNGETARLAVRKAQVLFIDGRKLGTLIEGSRKQKELQLEEVERISAVYREFKCDGTPEPVAGFAAVATIEKIAEHRYVLTPSRYVGIEEALDQDEPFEERFPALLRRLDEQFKTARSPEEEVRTALKEVVGGL